MEVGEYVRTKKGKIGRIIKVDEDNEWLETTLDVGYLHYYNEFIKHSKNIIDLIEVGDYVNGSKVVDIAEDMQTGELHLEMTYNYTNEEKGDCTIYNKDIKTIVTKEQFKAVEYEV